MKYFDATLNRIGHLKSLPLACLYCCCSKKLKSVSQLSVSVQRKSESIFCPHAIWFVQQKLKFLSHLYLLSFLNPQSATTQTHNTLHSCLASIIYLASNLEKKILPSQI